MGTADRAPLLRGQVHVAACPMALVAGIWLAILAPNPRAVASVVLFCGALAAIFGMSSLLHRGRWTERAHRRVRQLDHAMIYLGMAMIYTAFWLSALDSLAADALLAVVWTGAVAGMLAKLRYIDAPPTRHWLFYVGFALTGLIIVPELVQTMGASRGSLVLVGGGLYVLGSVAYVLRRPNPFPRVLGYHELFHLGTVGGAACQLVALASFVLAGD